MMIRFCSLLVIGALLIVSHSIEVETYQNYKESIYNGFDVLRKVANTILRKEHFRALLTNVQLRQTVRPICPLLERHKQVKIHIESGEAANITELKAAQVILEYVLNDTCIWIQTLPYMSNFTCTTDNLTQLEIVCIEIEIKDIADEQRDILLGMYSDENEVHRYSLKGNKRWIEEAFNGENTTVIDTSLYAIKKYTGFKRCNRNEQTVSC